MKPPISILVLLGLTSALVLADLEAIGFGITGLVALVHILVVPLLGIVLTWRGTRGAQPQRTTLGIACLAAAVFAFIASAGIAGRQEMTSQIRGDQLSQLLHQWRQSHGSYPARLDDLVPSLLAAVPSTTMGAFGARPYHYSVNASGDDYMLRFDTTAFVVCARNADGPWRCDD